MSYHPRLISSRFLPACLLAFFFPSFPQNPTAVVVGRLGSYLVPRTSTGIHNQNSRQQRKMVPFFFFCLT